jgi:YHS domain-containing protein
MPAGKPVAAAPAAGGHPGAASQEAVARVKDVICGMDVDPREAAAAGLKSEYKGTTYFFCSDQCKKRFGKEPGKYANK